MNFPRPVLSGRISLLNYGAHRIKPAYSSPIPVLDDTLNVCPHCITAHPTPRSLHLHMEKCSTVPYPPLYKEAGTGIKIAQVPDLRTKQLLCLLGRLFIKNKTLFYEVSNYDVFIIYGQEVMGYFSRPQSGNYSLSCIAVWPCFARQGLGSLLIDFSYLRTGRACSSVQDEGAPDGSQHTGDRAASELQNEDSDDGSNKTDGHQNSQSDHGGEAPDGGPSGPERPFSKAAIFCFRRYWKYRVVGARSVRQIAHKANISVDDAIVGLELNGFDFKKWQLDGEIAVEAPRLLSKNELCRK